MPVLTAKEGAQLRFTGVVTLEIVEVDDGFRRWTAAEVYPSLYIAGFYFARVLA